MLIAIPRMFNLSFQPRTHLEKRISGNHIIVWS